MHVDPSPYRNPDGSMTTDALAGKALFFQLGCDFCHVAPDFTDSSRGMLHDVGTLKPSSGSRSGGPLLGIDTPTLLGVWETAPYLHDGSAPTLRDVLDHRQPQRCSRVREPLMPAQIDQLVAYLHQIDNELPPHRLPFEAAPLMLLGRCEAGAPEAAPPIVSAAPARRLRVRADHEPPRRSTWAGWALVPLLALPRPTSQQRARSEARAITRLAWFGCAARGGGLLGSSSGRSLDGTGMTRSTPATIRRTRAIGSAPSWTKLPAIVEAATPSLRVSLRAKRNTSNCARRSAATASSSACAAIRRLL